MAQTGSNTPSSFGRLNRFIEKHKSRALVVVGVLALIGILIGQVVPGVQDILIAKGVFTCLILLLVIDLARADAGRLEHQSLEGAVNQDEALPILIAVVPECRRETFQLLEYASATTLPFIRSIQREGATLQLLLKHPETVTGLQRQRMITTLDTLYNSIFDGYSGSFEARCYRQPYSLRGRRLGGRMLEVGWLTPDYRRSTAYGHANPSVLLEGLNATTKPFFDFFDRTFNDLWSAPDTEDAKVVMQRMQIIP